MLNIDDIIKTRLRPNVVTTIPELTQIRRHLHAHPETANNEYSTQKYLLEYLAKVNVNAVPIGPTGVVATIVGTHSAPPENQSKTLNLKPKTLLLRADMDALPITEINNVPYKSTCFGTMHACGHDGHMAMMLIAAKLLQQNPGFAGTVKILFQPAEEGGGGAEQMVNCGVLKDPTVDGALAFHVLSNTPVGTIQIHEGKTAASVDGFKLTVFGRGSHGAMPEQGIDPIVILSQIITGAQALISRRISATEPAVLSFCSIKGGKNFNIIPDKVSTQGTIRTFDETIRKHIKTDLLALAKGIAATFGATCTIEYFESISSVNNHPQMTKTIRQLSEKIVGSDNLTELAPLMLGEDFSLISSKVPGALIFLGCGNDSTASYPHHHPSFNLDEKVLPIGVELALSFVDAFFK